jgi:hypothetical protein
MNDSAASREGFDIGRSRGSCRSSVHSGEMDVGSMRSKRADAMLLWVVGSAPYTEMIVAGIDRDDAVYWGYCRHLAPAPLGTDRKNDLGHWDLP